MTDDAPQSDIVVGARVSFPYGGGRRVGTVAEISEMPGGNGSTTTAYLIDIGARKVFVQGEITIATATGPGSTFEAADGSAYGRRRPRSGGPPKRRR